MDIEKTPTLTVIYSMLSRVAVEIQVTTPAGQGRGGVGTTGIWASEYLAKSGTNGLL
jgi:hypothetical protein